MIFFKLIIRLLCWPFIFLAFFIACISWIIITAWDGKVDKYDKELFEELIYRLLLKPINPEKETK